MTFSFPKGFWWGTATAAHQVEGNNTNSDTWLLEHVPGTIFVEPSGDAIDHYHRYHDDIALLARLGFNMYRFSIEWARIEPEEGEFSLAALDHYRRMLATCHEHGIMPMVTFHHFTSPRWLIARGGWESKITPDRFARYCERATRHLGDLIGAACTINEANIGPLIVAWGYTPPADVLHQAPWWQATAQALGTRPDQLSSFMLASSPLSTETVLMAHRCGFEAIKAASASKTFPVGITLALQDIQAVPGGETIAAQKRHQINDMFYAHVKGDDFIGVQTYSRARFGPNGLLPPEDGVELTQMGYEFWPEALETTIRDAIAKTGLPVIVTESGIGTDDDSRRREYIRRALGGVVNCLRDGLDVRGYTYWSAFDNFEWMLGYRPTFGLVAVDRKTQVRTQKPSATYLGDIARKNALDSYM